jgi:hypothetical protein
LIRGDEGDESQDGKLAGAIGVSDAKRKLAVQLHVDPYTSNEALQSELDRVARAQTLGGLTLDVGSFFIGAIKHGMSLDPAPKGLRTP